MVRHRAARSARRRRRTPSAPAPVGDYLTVADVCIRTGYRRQTIYDLMVKGKLRQGVHYFKPGGNGRPLFKWSALQAWIEGREVSA